MVFSTYTSGFPFFVIWHRNHLGIMSAVSGQYSYDFSAPGAAFQNGTKDMGDGVFAMIAGDADADGDVNNTDKNEHWFVEAGSSGYLNSDFNMDTDVDNSDKNELWTPNSGSGTQILDGAVPELGYKCQVPK